MEAVNKSGLERQRWTHGVQRVGEAEVDTWSSVGWRDRDGLMGFRGLERERWTHGVQRVGEGEMDTWDSAGLGDYETTIPA